MRAFVLAFVAAAVLATAGAAGLNFAQRTSAQAYSTDAARLGPGEAVDAIGRQG